MPLWQRNEVIRSGVIFSGPFRFFFLILVDSLLSTISISFLSVLPMKQQFLFLGTAVTSTTKMFLFCSIY